MLKRRKEMDKKIRIAKCYWTDRRGQRRCSPNHQALASDLFLTWLNQPHPNGAGSPLLLLSPNNPLNAPTADDERAIEIEFTKNQVTTNQFFFVSLYGTQMLIEKF